MQREEFNLHAFANCGCVEEPNKPARSSGFELHVGFWINLPDLAFYDSNVINQPDLAIYVIDIVLDVRKFPGSLLPFLEYIGDLGKVEETSNYVAVVDSLNTSIAPLGIF